MKSKRFFLELAEIGRLQEAHKRCDSSVPNISLKFGRNLSDEVVRRTIDNLASS